ncbi:MAG: hypothetical protein ABSC94_10910 [Polyangiaceae bacterium]|jgi:hypothetical protein
MSARRAAWAISAFTFVSALSTIAGCGSDQAIVGGSCAPSYTQCGLHCVELDLDPANCGACGAACAPGVACTDGLCASSGDMDGAFADGSGTSGDASSDEEDGSLADAAVDDSSIADAPVDSPAADVGTQQDAPAADSALEDATGVDSSIVDSTTTDSATSDASIGDVAEGERSAADGSNEGDGSTDAPSIDATSCPVGLSPCSGVCVDLTSDPFHCGECKTVCPSQICTGSACVGATPGSLVYIGHDYETTLPSTAQVRVLTNSVLLAQSQDIHILSYERYADPTAVANVKSIVLTATPPPGGTLDITDTVNDSDVTNISYPTYAVLLVEDQANAQGEVDLGMLGGQWAATLSAFTGAGGIVVVLDGGTGASQMPALVSGTGLLAVGGHSPLPTGTQVDVLSPADSVGLGVLSPYAVGTNSVTLETEANGGDVIYVVGLRGDAGASTPVVVHKVLSAF